MSEVSEMSEKYDLIIRNAAIHTMDRDRRVIDRGTIAVKGDRIAKIEQGDLPEQDAAGQVIDADGMILFPGFIDTHIHIFQSFLKGLGADHRLIEWLNLSALP
jgi:5-methylthioadenosine/S-adenosylhomocysteine deaminase